MAILRIQNIDKFLVYDKDPEERPILNIDTFSIDTINYALLDYNFSLVLSFVPRELKDQCQWVIQKTWS